MILGIDNALLDVGELAAAREHYAALGLAERFAIPEAGIVLYAIGAERPGLLIRAVPDLPASPPAGPRIWLETADARAFAAACPLDPLAPPFPVRTGWTVEYADPWGNVLGVTDYTSDPARARPVPGERRP